MTSIAPERPKKKRARPTISCLECRRKKLKCDRVQPCVQCKRAGKQELCVFTQPGPGKKTHGVLLEGLSGGRANGAGNQSRNEDGRAGGTVEVTGGPSMVALEPFLGIREVNETLNGQNGGLPSHTYADRHGTGASGTGWFNFGSVGGGLGQGDELRQMGMRNDELRREIRPDERAWLGPAVKDPMPVSTKPVEGKEEQKPLGKICVKGPHTKYVGLADRMIMLEHFTSAKSFITVGFKQADVCPLMREMYVVHKHFISLQEAARKPTTRLAPAAVAGTDLMTEMIRALPCEMLAGAMVDALYQLHWESLTRILHAETFSRDVFIILKAFRTDTTGNPTIPKGQKESYIPQVFATMALAGRMVKKLVKNESVDEEEILYWTDLVERWIGSLKGNERLSFDVLQTQALLLLVHQANLATPSELWQESGALVRSAMLVGLHVDPEDCPDLTLFQKEQRRKLWLTIVELDTQFALGVGMPAAIRSSDLALMPLKNVNDINLIEDMPSYPPDKPESEWTEALLQITLSDFLAQRLDIVNALGTPLNLEKDAPILLQRAKALELCMGKLPNPLRSDTPVGRVHDKSSSKVFSKIMLDVYLRRPSLAVYRTIAFSSLSAHYPEARNAGVQSSIVILSHLDDLDPAVADISVIKSKDLLNLYHILCRQDIIEAALMLCLEIHRFSFNDEPIDRNIPLPPWTKPSLTRIVENTLNSLLQRLGEFGSDLKDILGLSIILQSVRADGTPDERKEMMRVGAERILKACSKVPSIMPTASIPTAGSNTSAHTNQAMDWNTDINSASTPSTSIAACDIGMSPFPPGSLDKDSPFPSAMDFDFDFGFAEWADQSWS